MGELLDREYQLHLMRRFAEFYPQTPILRREFPDRDNKFNVNVMYLTENGLLKSEWIEPLHGGKQPTTVEITARGLDFLQDDGGLSTILNVMTVRLHDDTIRQLLIAKVNASDAEASAKDQMIAAIKALPAASLTSLAQKAMDAGLENLPAAIGPLRGWLGL
ncbi:hypothetical protein [Falsirhodobacter sp. 20TX0035]|uniref:hypothetical protein n=1 Tax=Falsirhodobacter sp. 20TX0035 TaxID=3022019 RepID=UPI00232ACB6F|nr:hypothetical protein [Falsirhodobacter sp. 20TX0035]MDB6454691.1 hypothetical protein [Falsirhodobacter sp. 20TX0035]